MARSTSPGTTASSCEWRPTRESPVRSLIVTDGRRVIGALGEAAAARALERSGVRIVARNARTRYGEIDLIGQDRRGVVFVEVKTCRLGSFVDPREAVGPRKLARLRGLALAWAAAHRVRGPLRLVIAAVTVAGSETSVELIEVAG